MMKKILNMFMIVALAANVPASAGPPQGPTSSSPQPSSPSAQPSTGTSTSAPATSSGTTQGKGGGTGGAVGAGAGAAANAAGGAAVSAAKKATIPFGIYLDQGSKDNHYTPSGWMGDYGDIKMNPGCTVSPHSGKTSVRFQYAAKMSNNAGWAGVFWQNPANNWGDKQGGGFNLTGATRLTFWARGEKGGEKIAEFKVGGIQGEYPDSDSASLAQVTLTNEWKQYSIDLKGKDLSSIIGAFAWSASKDDNPEGMTIYIDDIRFE